jgi:hypothetical protein
MVGGHGAATRIVARAREPMGRGKLAQAAGVAHIAATHNIGVGSRRRICSW